MTEPPPIPVLYADVHLAVVDKPAGLMVHDSALARGETEFALDRLRTQFGRKVYFAHRLDRATSGCLLLAFEPQIAAALGKAFMAREIDKHYLAVVRGWPEAEGVIDHPLDGGPGKPLKKPASTSYTRLATAELPIPSGEFSSSRYALLRCEPQTGRFRQIRRHLKHIHHHLIGDSSHGDGRHNRVFRAMGVSRMLLHAERLTFMHPVSGESLQLQAPLDDEFRLAFARLAWSSDQHLRAAA